MKYISLYAKWTPSAYYISYNLNGGSNPSDQYTSYKYESPTFTLKQPSKAAYNFVGWSGSNNISYVLTQYTTSNPYTANSRGHVLGGDFAVYPGKVYRTYVTAKRTSGSLPMQGGILYTGQTSGNAWDTYPGAFTQGQHLGNGWHRYYKDTVVPEGKSVGKIYIQLDQDWSGGSTT